MNYYLQNKYELLEKEREELFSILKKMNHDHLNLKPASNKWSVTQIVFHLVKAEHLSLISAEGILKKREKLTTAGFGAKIRSSILNISLKSPLKFKAPQIMKKVPDTYDIEQLKKKWITLRLELKKLIDEFDDKNLDKNIFRHPYAGWLNFLQTLDFLHEHFNHHLRQIEKINNLIRSKI
jgi:DinB superfamily